MLSFNLTTQNHISRKRKKNSIQIYTWGPPESRRRNLPIGEMNQKENCAAHGFSIEERRKMLKFGILFDEIEEGKAILDDEIDVRDESFETARSAVAFEVKSEAGEALLGEEDGDRLESPADVVSLAVDHEDERSRRGERKP